MASTAVVVLKLNQVGLSRTKAVANIASSRLQPLAFLATPTIPDRVPQYYLYLHITRT